MALVSQEFALLWQINFLQTYYHTKRYLGMVRGAFHEFTDVLKKNKKKLEQLERLRSEDTPRRLMITHTIEPCWIPQVKTRSNDLEDIGQGQRSWHATHLLMLVIVCTTYGKNPSRIVDTTEGTRFSRSRPNDLENIGQGQRSLHATHPLMLMMICAKYGKNPLRTVDFFSRSRPKNFKNLPKIQIFRYCKKRNRRHTL